MADGTNCSGDPEALGDDTAGYLHSPNQVTPMFWLLNYYGIPMMIMNVTYDNPMKSLGISHDAKPLAGFYCGSSLAPWDLLVMLCRGKARGVIGEEFETTICAHGNG